ncbi:MAG TPA: flagellar hook-basal body complex protein FliE [Sphingobium sp.]|uniref:flagellar hook-basal body complex protein FliE n=1 Tax=Sphingobium sp. TaxID=1912891 RepID=UPI002ED5A29A
MSIGALDAVAAYGRATSTAAPTAVAAIGASEPGAGFGDMIETMVTEATSSLHAAEAASAKQVAGKGDMIDVATAIGSAEVALDTVVAVRDRVVSAYSEIMRMQI